MGSACPRYGAQRDAHHLLLIYILAAIPITAFALGTWQVQRLDWKTKLVAKLEDSVLKPPLPLPPRIDPDIIPEFDHRRVEVTGRFRHDKEMLIGPRIHDGNNGFLVITPLERDEGRNSVLVNRGWIKNDKQYQQDRRESLPQGEVTVEGMLREPFKKNMFTPDNKPEDGKYYFPDVVQMAQVAGTQPVWIEETMVPNLFTAMDREEKGIPIGRAAECTLRNNHAQYIFTWYSLAFATSIMFWMVVKKKPGPNARRIRHNTTW